MTGEVLCLGGGPDAEKPLGQFGVSLVVSDLFLVEGPQDLMLLWTGGAAGKCAEYLAYDFIGRVPVLPQQVGSHHP